MHLSLFTNAHLLTTCLHIFTKILHSLAGVQRGENNIFLRFAFRLTMLNEVLLATSKISSNFSKALSLQIFQVL